MSIFFISIVVFSNIFFIQLKLRETIQAKWGETTQLRLFPHQLSIFDLDLFCFAISGFLFIWSMKWQMAIYSGLFSHGSFFRLALCCVRLAAVQYPIEMREYLPQFIINFRRWFFWRSFACFPWMCSTKCIHWCESKCNAITTMHVPM